MWCGWDRLEDASLHITTNTKELSTAKATLPTSQNLHEEAHSFGPMNNIMQVLHHHKKEAHLKSIGRYTSMLNTQPATI